MPWEGGGLGGANVVTPNCNKRTTLCNKSLNIQNERWTLQVSRKVILLKIVNKWAVY